MAEALEDEKDWKRLARFDEAGGFYALETRDLQAPVRLFLSDRLLTEAEPGLYRQIVNATRFPRTRLVVITPDVHYGYGVPVGCVILTEREAGAVAMGPVGFDIGCGMVSARSDVPAEAATHDRKLAFHREVMARVPLGPGGASGRAGAIGKRAFEDIVRGGAEHYLATRGSSVDHGSAERDRIPVPDDWTIPWGGPGEPERGLVQLGTLGGGNHFIELQRCEETETLFVQLHTGSRGFGHGLATNYFAMARDEHPERSADIDCGYFEPGSPHYDSYLGAVAAGGNYAIVNRLMIFEAVAEAFEKVFKAELELVYEISHNLVQHEFHDEFGEVLVHRKGATRALPAGHPQLAGTRWMETGHPVLIPGSNRDASFILRPLAGARKSGYSVNHGAGRRLSRGQATKLLSQDKVNEQYRADGILVNLDGEVPLDEAGACYKPAQEVVDVVTGAGLAEIERTLWPLGSIKDHEGVRRRDLGRARRAKERDRDLERAAARRRRS
ncbi:MAG: RtcB family protein [Myxococcales bacterium]|nr:RtcB family protein [Myxococcales bacterium]